MAITKTGTDGIKNDAITGAKIADDAIGAEHIEVLDSHLQLTDNSNIKLGTGDDLLIYHNGSDSYVKNSTGDLYIRDTNGNIVIQPKTDENAIKCLADGAVEIYHDNVKTLYTSTTGAILKAGATGGDSKLQIYGNEGQRAVLQLGADDGDDNADYWQFQARTDGNLNIQNYNGGSWVNSLILRGGGASELYHDNNKKLETTSLGATVTGSLGINTSSPSTGLQVHKDWVSNYGSVSVEGSTNALVGYGFRSNGTYKGGLIYRDGTSGSYLDLGTYNGDHPILFRPNATEEVRIDADGLKFNGDTAATNALDDYEEGTHETTVTISGNTSFSYSSRNLAYTKIGRVVHLLGRINMTGAGGGSSFEFTLPFPCADGSPDYQYETSNEFQVIRGDDSRTFRIREGESAAKCQSDGSAAGIGDSSPHINVNLTYFTNS